MGLDNFWLLPKSETSHPNFDPPLNLCGGMFSNHGSHSFRGKVYANFCEQIMGINLYQDILTSEEIKEGLSKLNDYIKNQTFNNPDFSNYNLLLQEILDLQRMFEKYSQIGAELESWY